MAVTGFDSHWHCASNHQARVGSPRDAQNLRNARSCGYRILVDYQMLRIYQLSRCVACRLHASRQRQQRVRHTPKACRRPHNLPFQVLQCLHAQFGLFISFKWPRRDTSGPPIWLWSPCRYWPTLSLAISCPLVPSCPIWGLFVIPTA